ncbi:hypothetical protein QE424_002750 [Stenotrophomonas rhizophila]|uniref:Uncharacterized protein n=1 Tax=Stenotrophomonas rhizophila TaxID=216778 RepID=A0AAP5EEH8_9GAMM|nr:hypothetical protein [Stenotrophomonas rhizophila]MDQ1109591.1 hypothetical protein [Stenotrophomonas rhizophila]
MSWDKDSLWLKAVLFMERAFKEDREGDIFPLWASMGLELLCRSAVAHVSPLLLAEPERDQKNALHILGFGTASPKSINTNQVLGLCKVLFTDFTDEEVKAASTLVGRRNEELHTGAAAYASFRVQDWLPAFFRCCDVLATAVGESLDSLLGAEEAAAARDTLVAAEKSIESSVRADISAHAKVFGAKEDEERRELAEAAQRLGDELAGQRHHRVACPACECVATVQGSDVGPQRVEHGDGCIIVRQTVLPNRFVCTACGLKLNGYQALRAAGVANHFTRRSELSPSAYYQLIDPEDSSAMDEYMRDYAELHDYYQFNNE